LNTPRTIDHGPARDLQPFLPVRYINSGSTGISFIMETFLQTYGYWDILIGTFLEGETILVLGGLAAHMGYMDLSGVILSAFTGSLCGDQLFSSWGAATARSC